MSYLFNIAVLIKSIRGEDYNSADSQFTDADGRELSFRGHLIKLDDFAVMHRGLVTEYKEILHREIFFGQPLPDWFTRAIDIESLVDDPRDHTAGYSFIDHPQNGFSPFFPLYGQWLLSDPERATEFADYVNGTVVWKSARCFQHLRSFSKLRLALCIIKIIDVGPSVRATEMARDLLRNVSGASVRSLMILFHTLCIVGIQDKTSHKILKKRFTPGAPSFETSVELVRNLVYFRRFETDLVRYFKGDREAERYATYLWPDVRSNFTGDEISERLGVKTTKYLRTRLKILEYRNVTTAIMRFHFGATEDIEGDQFYDVLSNHSSSTSSLKYGIDRNTLANAPMHHIIGCLRATINWQKLTRTDGGKPLKLAIGATRPGSVLLPDIAGDPDSKSGRSCCRLQECC